MQYDLTVINNRITKTPAQYILESEEYYSSRIRKAAELIINNVDLSPIVLLSGPSGSGKTTTAKKLASELMRLGINAHKISLDNYFKTVDPDTAPRTPAGEIDYESPECLDMDLLNDHFEKLDAGMEIEIPHFSFSRQERLPDRTTVMKPGKNEIAIFEGIHALNERFTQEHPSAFRLYVSTLTDIAMKGRVVIDHTGMRLVRRIVRDDNFRGTDPSFTLRMWENIRRGEILNILPFKGSAHMTIDSALPYEISVMKQFTGDVFDKVPEDDAHFDILRQIMAAFDLFADVDASLVPGNSILREFIGGSDFKY